MAVNKHKQGQTSPIEGSVFESVWVIGGVERVTLLTVIAVGLFAEEEESVFYTLDRFPGIIGVQRLEDWDAFQNAWLQAAPLIIDTTVVISETRGVGLLLDQFMCEVVKRGNKVFINHYNESDSKCLTTIH